MIKLVLSLKIINNIDVKLKTLCLNFIFSVIKLISLLGKMKIQKQQ